MSFHGFRTSAPRLPGGSGKLPGPRVDAGSGRWLGWMLGLFLAIGGAPQAHTQSLAPGGHLLAYWKFEEGQGRRTFDSAGPYSGLLSRNGAALGAEGIAGGAVALDRSFGYGQVNFGPDLTLTEGAYSVSLWMRLNPGANTRNQRLISKQGYWESGGYYLMLDPMIDHAPTVRGYAGDGVVLDAFHPVDDGQWHHLVMAHEASGESRLYIDGGAPKVVAHGTGPLPPSVADVTLGGINDNITASWFEGRIDEIQVYDFALNDPQVEALRANPGNPLDPAMVPAVHFIPAAGTYQTSVEVRLLAPEPTTVLRYTVDGTDPDENAPIYAQPIPWSQSGTLKVRRYLAGVGEADVFAATYQVLPDPIPTGPLIARWRFDEDSGGTVFDDTGRYPGTLSPAGVYRAPDGISGRSVSLLPSEGGLIRLPKFLPRLESAFSISAWFRLPSLSGGRLFSRQTWQGTDGYSLSAYAGYPWTVRGVSSTTVQAGFTDNDTHWHHVVMTYEAGGQQRVYIDGGTNMAETAAPPILPTESIPCFGCVDWEVMDDKLQPNAELLLDEVRMYDTVLTPRQVDFLRAHPTGELSFAADPPLEMVPAGGTFVETVTVRLERWLHASEIHYTLDGSEPSPQSPRYTGPLTFTADTRLRARCYLGDLAVTPEVSGFFAVPVIPTPTGDLVARWRFDDGWSAGDYVVEDTGRYHSRMTAAGATWDAHGAVGGALALGGQHAGYVALQRPFPLLTAPYTIAVWMRPTYPGGSVAFSQHVPDTDGGYYLGMDRDGYAEGFSGGVHVAETSVGRIFESQWHHLVMTHEASGRLRLFVDATNHLATVQAQPVIPTDVPALIGGIALPAPAGLFTGGLDDLQIYNFAANLAQVHQLLTQPGSTLVPVIGPPLHLLPEGGAFVDSTYVTLSAAVDSTEIRYTTDGSDPGPTSTLYREPFLLTSSGQVRARRFSAGTPVGESVAADFTITRSSTRPATGYLLAHFRFESVLDGLSLDETGWNHGHVSPGGVFTVVDGIDGNCASFTRSANGHILLGDTLPLDGQAYTISWWIRLPPGAATPNAAILGKYNGWNPGGYGFALDPTGRSLVAKGGEGPEVANPHPLDDGAWHHVALTCTSYGRLRLAVDGDVAEAETRVALIAPTLTQAVIGGADYYPPAGRFNGSLDDLQYYDFAATWEQIEFLRQHPGQTLTSDTLVRPGLPTITSEPLDAERYPGESVSFGVEATGVGPLFYQWTFNGNLLANSNAPSLTLRGLTESAAGVYRVRVSNPNGTVESRAARLTLKPFPEDLGPVRMVQQPVSQVVYLGEPVSFTIRAIGQGPFVYRWLINGIYVQGAYQATLSIPATTEFTSGPVQAEVVNNYGAVRSDVARLEVLLHDAPTVAPPSGRYVGSVRVSISSPMSQAVYNYTTDGSEPTLESPRYNGWIPLQQTTTLKTRAHLHCCWVSPTATTTYEVVPRPALTGRLLAHWPLDETQGPVAHDATGIFDGTFATNGVTFGTPGIHGTAVQFHRAEGGFVDMGDVLPMIDTSFSVSLWMKTSPGDTTANAALFAKHVLYGASGYYVVLNNGSHPLTAMVGATTLNSDVTVNDGAWHHVVLSHTLGEKTRLYVDGTPSRDSRNATPVADSLGHFVLGGADYFTPVATYEGSLDEVQIYRFALSDREVELLRSHPGAELDAITAPTVQILPSSGSFDRPVVVTLVATPPDTQLRYTLDGAEPDANSTTYAAPFTLSTSTTVRAAAFVNGQRLGEISSATYVIQTPPRLGPLAHWRFDEGGGTTAGDDTGAYPGALASSGVHFVPGGVSGGCLEFSRANGGYVSLGDVLPLNDTSFSVALWFRVPAGDSTRMSTLFSKHFYGSNAGYYTTLNHFGSIKTYLGDPIYLTSGTAYNDGRWHHLVLSNEAGKRSRLYFDGSPANVEGPAANLGTNHTPTMLGALAGDPITGHFEGWLDDVQIYGYAIQEAEVDALRQAPGFELGQVPAEEVQIQPPGGTFTTPTAVTLTSRVPNAVIRYTLDGSWPSASSLGYRGAPLLLTNSVRLLAAAFVNGSLASRVAAASFVVNVPVPPVLRTSPASLAVAVGAEVRFQASVGGTWPLTYTWFKDGTVIDGAMTPELLLKSVSRSDAGSYWLQVTNIAGRLTTAPATLTVTNGAQADARELLARWPLDDQSGNQAVDETARAHATLSETGAQFVTDGKIGGALALDQSQNGFARVGDVLPLMGQSFSIALWMKTPPGMIASGSGMIARHRLGTSEGYYVALQDGHGTLRGYAGGGDVLIGTSPVVDGAWHHVVLTHELGAQTRVYVDGAPAQVTAPSGSVTATRAALILGGFESPSGPVGRFTGLLDDIQIYSFALTDAEVDQLRRHPGEVLDSLVRPGVSINPPGGGFTTPVEVRLVALTPGTEIRYTIDGSDPTPSSPIYTSPWTLASSTVVKAAGFLDGVLQGPVARADFAIQLPVGPRIVQQPLDQTVDLGATATFTVVAEGSGPLGYHWLRNGAQFAANAGPSLVIRNVSAELAGTFHVVVSNSVNRVTSSPANLVVHTPPPPPQPPTIQVPPASRRVIAGEAVEWRVTATGDQPLTYAWYFNGQPLPQVSESRLRWSAVTEAEAGQYFVEVSNPAGTARSPTVTLTVDPPPPPQPPVITVQPQPSLVRVEAGSTLTLRVQASGTEPLTYAWYNREERVANAGAATLSWTPVEARHTGRYSVRISNSAGAVQSQTVSVLVEDRPASDAGTVIFLNRHAENLDAPVFAADGVTPLAGPDYVAQLFVGAQPEALTAVGAPAPFGTGSHAGYWDAEHSPIRYLTGVDPGQSVWAQVRVWNFALAPEDATAQRQGFAVGRSRIFRTSTGGAGTPPSLPSPLLELRSFALNQATPPVVITDPASAEVRLGEPLQLVVQAAGDALEYRWFHGGESVPGADGTVLSLAATRLTDAGTYVAVVTNAGGSVTSQVATVRVLVDRHLTIQAEPATSVREGALARFAVRLQGQPTSRGSLHLTYDPTVFSALRVLDELPESAGRSSLALLEAPGQLRLDFSLRDARSVATESGVRLATFEVRTSSSGREIQSGFEIARIELWNEAGAAISGGTETRNPLLTVLPDLLAGDLNGNDRLEVGDATLLLQAVRSAGGLNAREFAARDLDNDHQVARADALELGRRILLERDQRLTVSASTSLTTLTPERTLRLTANPAVAIAGRSLRLRVSWPTDTGAPASLIFSLEYPTAALRLPAEVAWLAGTDQQPEAVVMGGFPDLSANPEQALLHVVACEALPWPAGAGIADLTFLVRPEAAAATRITVRARGIESSNTGYDFQVWPTAEITLPVQPSQPPKVGRLEGGGQVPWTLEATADPGVTLQLESSIDLLTWSPAENPVSSDGGRVRLALPPSGSPACFYRLVERN